MRGSDERKTGILSPLVNAVEPVVVRVVGDP
jgi:hypothetical protein